MKSRDIAIGFVFLVVLIAGVLWLFKGKTLKSNLPLPTPNIASKINNAFPNLNIPAGADKADLSGAQGVGVATRQKTSGRFTITVMADLPTPTTGSYMAVLSNGSAVVQLGRLSLTKSGYLVNFSSVQDLSAYNKVTVTLNGNSLLEGSF